MATFSRKVTVDWSGSIMEGKGVAKAGTGAFNLPVTFPSRVGEPQGTTSPEELMAASHAACYAMALNATLGRKNASAGRTVVTAEVVARIASEGFALLDAPPMRLNAKDTPIPYHPNLWGVHRPTAQAIAHSARKLVRM